MTVFPASRANRVYLHSAIQAFAETGGGVFFLALLLKAGLTPPVVLWSMAAILMGRFALRSGVLPLARRLGLRRTLILGTLLESSTYWLTPHVAGVGMMLYAVICMGAVSSVIYWTCYHAYVAASGKSEERGKQVGIIEAVNGVVAIVAPAIVGLLIVNSGPLWSYAAVAMVQMAAAIPLLDAADFAIPNEADAGKASRRLGGLLFGFDGLAVGFTHFVWLIALFVTLGERFGDYGWAMALAGLAGAAASLLVGRLIDLGHGGRSVLFVYGLAMTAALAKSFAVETPWAAVAAAAFGSVAGSVQIPVIMARIYTLAQESGCTLRFHMATEAGWDLGCAFGCILAGLLIAAGMPIGTPILFAIFGLGVAAVVLRRSYSEKASS